MPLVKAAPRRNEVLGTLICLAALVLLFLGAIRGLSVWLNWSVHHSIDQYESAITSSPTNDDSTVVLGTMTDANGSRWAYYKLGHGQYAQRLREEGIGCRFYSSSGEPYRLGKFKASDAIPFDYFASGSWVRGFCDVDNIPGFDLKQARL